MRFPVLLFGLALALESHAQVAPPTNLSLADAKAWALRNNPRIGSAEANAQAAGSVVKEVRSARLPSVAGLATGVDAQHSTVLAAGTLQTSSLYTRLASGISVSQLITDFGRTTSLTDSARLREQAQVSNGRAVREQVLLTVEQAYFGALGGNAAQRAAQAAVANRETTLRQIRGTG